MLLIYDATCAVCRSLAHKIHFSSGKEVEIRALSDPEAIRVLDGFYPAGWTHNFYVVDGGTCRRGIRAVRMLSRRLGLRQVSALIGEYATYKTSRQRCRTAVHDHDADGHQSDAGTSRRDVLKFAALSPVVAYGAAKLPKLADPFQRNAPAGFRVNVATVRSDGKGGFVVRAQRRDDAIRSTPNVQRNKRPATNVQSRSLGERTIRDAALPALGGAALRTWQTITQYELTRDGDTRRAQLAVHAAGLDHARFNIGANVGYGPVVTMAGIRDAATMATMIRHDVPVPVIDIIRYQHTSGDDVPAHFDGYVAGLRQLRALHQQDGNVDLARLYAEVERGLVAVRSGYADALPEHLLPITNDFVITSMPEALKFVEVPQDGADEHPELPAIETVVDEALGKVCGCGCADGCSCCGCGKCGGHGGCSCCQCDGCCGCGCCSCGNVEAILESGGGVRV